MEENKNSKFYDKLIQLRREKGLSQEQLADYLSVSRQAVSKWEAGQTMPALDKIILLADIFGVSVDYLVRDNAILEEKNKTVVTTADDTAVMNQLDEIKQLVKGRSLINYNYEYKSKKTIAGMPLIHIKFSGFGRPAVAKGIIALGNIAIGAISFGIVSAGIISFGAIALGLLLALGAISIGTISLGAVSIGVFACGGVAIGVYAIGGFAKAIKVASGGYASAHIAIGDKVSGEHTFNELTSTKEEASNLIKEHYPKLSALIRDILTSKLSK
jgi:transcriptional regulator with XRE-family HTH domain